MIDLFVRVAKHLIPPHELVMILHHWFRKTEFEIHILMSKTDLSWDEIEHAIVKGGIRPETSVLVEALKELTVRLKVSGLTLMMVRHQLLAAGFTSEEVDEIHELQASGEAPFERLRMMKFNDSDQPPNSK